MGIRLHIFLVFASDLNDEDNVAKRIHQIEARVRKIISLPAFNTDGIDTRITEILEDPDQAYINAQVGPESCCCNSLNTVTSTLTGDAVGPNIPNVVPTIAPPVVATPPFRNSRMVYGQREQEVLGSLMK
jgi:hypothetical protein